MVKRLTAHKVRLCDIVKGKYFAGSAEELEPSFVITPFGQRVSRVNIIATVVDKFVSEDEMYATLTLDDGTEAIRVKAFKEGVKLLKDVEPGDLVQVIGKLREYEGEVYVGLEVVRKLTDPNCESLRKLEILDGILEQKSLLEELKTMQSQLPYDQFLRYAREKLGLGEESLKCILEATKKVDYKPSLLKLIEQLDEGEGVEISRILELSELPEDMIESTIRELLNLGYVYEPQPGILKKVGD